VFSVEKPSKLLQVVKANTETAVGINEHPDGLVFAHSPPVLFTELFASNFSASFCCRNNQIFNPDSGLAQSLLEPPCDFSYVLTIHNN